MVNPIFHKVDLQKLLSLNSDLSSYGFSGIELSLKSEDICSFDKDPDETSIFKMLNQKNIKAQSLHAPFIDLSLASEDTFVFDYSLKVLLKALAFAKSLQIPYMVFHLGFHPFLPFKKRETSYAIFKEGLTYLNNEAKKARITLLAENTYEKDFFYFEKLFSDFSDISMTLDVGHCHCFSDFSALQWQNAFSSQIKAYHLHDNNHKTDDHCSLGQGNIDFKPIFKAIQKQSSHAFFTLETPLHHAEENFLFLKKLLST